MAAEAGRDPDDVPITIFGAPEDARPAASATATWASRAWWSALPSAKADEILPMLDRWAALIEALR